MESKTEPDDKPPPHTIGMPDLQFMEVDFLKPTTKGPKAMSHNVEGLYEQHIRPNYWRTAGS